MLDRLVVRRRTDPQGAGVAYGDGHVDRDPQPPHARIDRQPRAAHRLQQIDFCV
jgi:prepilin-type processing-associated H-X9-DG protein